MPFEMPHQMQAVVIGGNIYTGGGYSSESVNQQIVMVYTLHTGSWRTLPPYESRSFGMATVHNHLVLVGGDYPSTGKATNVLGVWNEGSQKWTHPFPVLPTPRSQVSVTSYHKWLIVAGGFAKNGQCTTKVEILDTYSRQWYEACLLYTSPSPRDATLSRMPSSA